jgi:hypothetical protein
MPVNKWNSEIQQGVYNMTCLVIELIAIRVDQTGVPEVLLNTLSLVNTVLFLINSHGLFYYFNNFRYSIQIMYSIVKIILKHGIKLPFLRHLVV